MASTSSSTSPPIHGGRGYVDLHQAACASNLALDGILFDAASRAGVEKVVYASSGCVYPNFRGQDPDEILYLTEEMVGPPYDADNMYGWAKLMAEMTLQAYARERGMKAASCRYFTVYGERGKEDHAVIAMIARAFISQDPFVVWGDGAADPQLDLRRRHRVRHDRRRRADRRRHGRQPRHDGAHARDRRRPRGAWRTRATRPRSSSTPRCRPARMNRVADNALAKELIGWEPTVPFMDGLHRTIDWYFATKDPAEVAANLEASLTER